MRLSFRRQVPIAGYIVDFACPHHRLIVDTLRTKRLEQDGWTVLRFWNDDILRDIDGVCQHLVVTAGLAVSEEAISS